MDATYGAPAGAEETCEGEEGGVDDGGAEAVARAFAAVLLLPPLVVVVVVEGVACRMTQHTAVKTIDDKTIRTEEI